MTLAEQGSKVEADDPASGSPAGSPSLAGRMSLDVLAAMGRHAAVAIAGLLTIPLIARRLGADGLGAWALIGTSSFLLGMSDLGLTTVVHRAAAIRAEPELGRRAVGLALLAVAVVGPVLAIVAYPLLLDLPGASPELLRDMAHAMAIAFPAGLVGAFGGPFRGFALVRGAIGGLARARMMASFAQVLVTAGGLWVMPSLVAPALGLLASSLVETSMCRRLARSIDPEIPLGPRRWSSRAELRNALRDGAATLVLNLVLAAGTRADILILASAGSLPVVAGYSVASRAVEQSFTLAKQTSTAMVPRLGDAEARGQAVRFGTGLLGALVTAGLTALAVNGQPLLVLWAGPAAEGAVTLTALQLLGLASVLASTYEIAASALTLGGRTAWEGAIPIGTGCLVNVAISIAGVRHFGVWAVAGGTVAGNVISCLMTWHGARRLLGWPRSAVLFSYLPALLAGVASLGAGLGLRVLLPPSPGASAAACVLATLAGCGAAALLVLRARRGGAA